MRLIWLNSTVCITLTDATYALLCTALHLTTPYWCRGGGGEHVRQNRILSLLFHCLAERTFVKVFLRNFPEAAEV
jgi:hypothetical protein